MCEEEKRVGIEAEVFGCIKSSDYLHSIYLNLVLSLSKSSHFDPKPGQFVLLEPLDKSSQWRRPFTIVDYARKECAAHLSLLIKAVGTNTRAYLKLNFYDSINIYGPQGSPIKFESHFDNYILVGGGIGGAALPFIAKELQNVGKPYRVLLGANTERHIAGLSFFKKLNSNVVTITDDKGIVTNLLKEVLEKDNNGRSVIIACGPKAMMRRTAEMCAKYGNRCKVILEENMACGSGACKGCAVKMLDGSYAMVCKDGPAFDAFSIDWDAYMREQPAVEVTPLEKKPLAENPLRVVLNGQSGKKLELKSPIMYGSGCADMNSSYTDAGSVVTKGVSFFSREGNPMPRVCETPSGMLNSIGLQNKGVEAFIEKELPVYLEIGLPVVVNILGKTVNEYVELARSLQSTGITGIEINISCPNVKQGGISFGTDPNMTQEIVRGVCEAAPDKFIITKLTPNVTDILRPAKAAVEGGTDAISLVNTFTGMTIDIENRRPVLGNVIGGLSGPAIRPIALRMVYDVHRANLGVPIIGMGGIDDGRSAVEFFIAGASAVGIGTGFLKNPKVASDVVKYLKEYLKRHGFCSIRELTGSLRV